MYRLPTRPEMTVIRNTISYIYLYTVAQKVMLKFQKSCHCMCSLSRVQFASTTTTISIFHNIEFPEPIHCISAFCCCCVVLSGAILHQANSLSNFIKSHIIYGEQFLTELISRSGIDYLSGLLHPFQSRMIAPSLGTGQV